MYLSLHHHLRIPITYLYSSATTDVAGTNPQSEPVAPAATQPVSNIVIGRTNSSFQPTAKPNDGSVTEEKQKE